MSVHLDEFLSVVCSGGFVVFISAERSWRPSLYLMPYQSWMGGAHTRRARPGTRALSFGSRLNGNYGGLGDALL